MSIIFLNKSSEIVEDFSGIEGYVSMSGADIYLDEEPFGYYYAAWLTENPTQIDIVVNALIGTEQHSLAVVCTYIISKDIFVSEGVTSLYSDPEWLEQNNVVPDSHVHEYTRAVKAKELAPYIIDNDEHIVEIRSA